MTPRALAAALFLALAAPAGAAKVLIIGDSHSVGPFGSSLDSRLREKGAVTALEAVCGASANWWLGPKRAKLSICWSIHGYGGRNSPQNGALRSMPPTAAELAATGPEVVVIALGSNPDGATAADTAAAAEKLVSALPQNARCYWIGPPPMPKRLAAIDEVYKVLPRALFRASRAGPSCALIDSRIMIAPKDAAANDHFYGEAAVAWGRYAADEIKL
jgi:hypothetical protein